MKSRKILATFLSATMICSQMQSFTPSVLASSESMSAPKSESASSENPLDKLFWPICGGLVAIGALAGGGAVVYHHFYGGCIGDAKAKWEKEHKGEASELLSPANAFNNYPELKFENLGKDPANVPGARGGESDTNKPAEPSSSKQVGPESIFVQVGNTKEENIALTTLKELLESHKKAKWVKGEKDKLQAFFLKHKTRISAYFISTLKNNGYDIPDAEKIIEKSKEALGIFESKFELDLPKNPEELRDHWKNQPRLVKNGNLKDGSYTSSNLAFMTRPTCFPGGNMNAHSWGISTAYAWVSDMVREKIYNANPDLKDLKENRISVYKDKLNGEERPEGGPKAKVETWDEPTACHALDRANKNNPQSEKWVGIAASMEHPGGGRDGALTQEENTLMLCCNAYPALMSKGARPYYECFDVNNYNPYLTMIFENVALFSSYNIDKDHHMKYAYGLEPSLLGLDSEAFKLNQDWTPINSRAGFHGLNKGTLVFLSAPTKDQLKAMPAESKKTVAEKTYVSNNIVEKRIKQLAFAVNDARQCGRNITHVIVPKFGGGVYATVDPKCFDRGGIVEQTWEKYADPNVTLVIMNPKNCNEDLNIANEYIENARKTLKELPGYNGEYPTSDKPGEREQVYKYRFEHGFEGLDVASRKLYAQREVQMIRNIAANQWNKGRGNVLSVQKDYQPGGAEGPMLNFGQLKDALDANKSQDGFYKGKEYMICYCGADAIDDCWKDMNKTNAGTEFCYENAGQIVWKNASGNNPYRVGTVDYVADSDRILTSENTVRFVEYCGYMVPVDYNGFSPIRSQNMPGGGLKVWYDGGWATVRRRPDCTFGRYSVWDATNMKWFFYNYNVATGAFSLGEEDDDTDF